MKLSQINEAQIADRLQQGALLLGLPPFVARIASDVPGLAGDIGRMYGEFVVCDTDAFPDFHIAVTLDGGMRRWGKPVARFAFDGKRSFLPLPAAQAFPMMEWGLNWFVAAHAHQYLVIHAAVVSPFPPRRADHPRPATNVAPSSWT